MGQHLQRVFTHRWSGPFSLCRWWRRCRSRGVSCGLSGNGNFYHLVCVVCWRSMPSETYRVGGKNDVNQKVITAKLFKKWFQHDVASCLSCCTCEVARVPFNTVQGGTVVKGATDPNAVRSVTITTAISQQEKKRCKVRQLNRGKVMRNGISLHGTMAKPSRTSTYFGRPALPGGTPCLDLGLLPNATGAGIWWP
jgi:hypothetical protein